MDVERFNLFDAIVKMPESGIRKPESGIRKPESGIRKPESKPESIVRDVKDNSYCPKCFRPGRRLEGNIQQGLKCNGLDRGKSLCRSCTMMGRKNRGRGITAMERRVRGKGWQIRVEGKWKMKSHIVMEQILGRKLTNQECVKFTDGDAENLSVSNLILGRRGRPFEK